MAADTTTKAPAEGTVLQIHRFCMCYMLWKSLLNPNNDHFLNLSTPDATSCNKKMLYMNKNMWLTGSLGIQDTDSLFWTCPLGALVLLQAAFAID